MDGVPLAKRRPVVNYRIEGASPYILAVTFVGHVEMTERLQAWTEIETTSRFVETDSFLVDLSRADLGAYGAVEALELAQRMSALRRPFGKIAFVMRQDQDDMAVGVVVGVHAHHLIRRFATRDEATHWLRSSHGV